MSELVYNSKNVKVGKIWKMAEYCFPDDFVNPWTALAWLAVKNKRIGIGSLDSKFFFRN